jgi:hypothetical protein
MPLSYIDSKVWFRKVDFADSSKVKDVVIKSKKSGRGEAGI